MSTWELIKEAIKALPEPTDSEANELKIPKFIGRHSIVCTFRKKALVGNGEESMIWELVSIEYLT